ncbi:hypothetical protein FB451DRAFT_1479899 [Mycena latifolia]|nr:hypothetical protein FB451DRAFT_1479899 [Mycena latifolia]
MSSVDVVEVAFGSPVESSVDRQKTSTAVMENGAKNDKSGTRTHATLRDENPLTGVLGRPGFDREHSSLLVSVILVLYSPQDVASSFFAQLLNVYSLIVAAIISIAGKNLTKMHSVIALTLASPSVFGLGIYLNRVLVLLMLPLWAAVLSFTALPTSFQQAVCDSGHFHGALRPRPAGVAIFRQRKIIWKKADSGKLPLGRMWRKAVNHYPFVQFYSVIVIPHFFWIFNIEVGLVSLYACETFSAAYGQLRRLCSSSAWPALYCANCRPCILTRIGRAGEWPGWDAREYAASSGRRSFDSEARARDPYPSDSDDEQLMQPSAKALGKRDDRRESLEKEDILYRRGTPLTLSVLIGKAGSGRQLGSSMIDSMK